MSRYVVAPLCSAGLTLALSLAPVSLIVLPLIVAPLSSIAAEPPAAAANAAAPISYSIPAGPLSAVLNRFAAESGIFLAGDANLTDGKQSRGLQGRYGIDEALRRLLSGTGVEAVSQASGRYTLRAAPDKSAVVLPAMKVSAAAVAGSSSLPAYAGGQVARGGRLGLLGDTAIMDAPFSITSYTAQIIEDQQARSIVDVLANDPSVRSASARTNINEDFTVRGLPVPSSDIAFNGMYGVTPWFRVPVEMAERVEVLKGPSALLNGMPPGGSIGGAINLIPKRATAEPLTRVTAEYLSESIYGAHVDAGRRFGGDNAFGARFNGVLRDGESTVDYQQSRDELATLALDFSGERLRASLDFYYQQQEIDGVVRQFMVVPGFSNITQLPKAPDGTVSYPGSWADLEMEDSGGVARVEYDLSDAVTLYAGAGQRSSSMDSLAGNPILLNEAGDYTSTPGKQVFDIDSDSHEVGLDAAFTTGSVSHQLALGATRVEQEQQIYFNPAAYPTGMGNLYESDDSRDLSSSGFSINKVPYVNDTLTSYAIADTLGFLGDRLSVTLGLRRQRVETQNFNYLTGVPTHEPYDEEETTPVVGVIVKPWQQISLYANYIEGLSPGPKAPLGTPSAAIAPFVSKQTEVGVKGDWGNVGGTVALYQLDQPGGALVGTVFTGNEQRLRGLELNVFGAPIEAVRVLGGLSWIDAEMTKTDGGINEGNDAIGVPELQANIGGEWDTPFLPGFTLTARAIYTGETYVNAANTLEAEAWTRIDIGARYRTEAFDKALVLRASVENLFDENYWGVHTAGYLHVGEARTVLMSATIDF